MAHEALSTDALSGTVLLANGPTTADVQAQAADPLIGVVLSGAYRIECVLGEGAMGKLYAASHLRLDRRFAIKVLHLPLAQRDDMRARFDREARVMSRIKSDHVVDVVDVALAPDGRACIVTELLEGLDLEQHLNARGEKLPIAEAVFLTRQCLRGLSAAHGLGVVHRDLKPSNLFLARDMSARVALKVLDFGVAKDGGNAELTAVGTVMGTPAYMAPEQARGARFADARSDLYAVGAVLYRMLTGRPPYEEADVNATLIRLMQEAPERPSTLDRSIPPALEALIERSMARDPAARFQSAIEFDAALAVFDSGEHDSFAIPEPASRRAASAAELTTLTRRARAVRPLAIASCVLLGLASGCATTSILALLVNGLSKAATLGSTELLLVGLGGGVSFVAVLATSLRSVFAAWRSATVVQELTRHFATTLLAFAAALGALELLGVVLATALHKRPTDVDAVNACLRACIAVAVGFSVFLRTRRR
jgi:eukaryotic-like serine/threonine-protein kinase